MQITRKAKAAWSQRWADEQRHVLWQRRHDPHRVAEVNRQSPGRRFLPFRAFYVFPTAN